MGAFAVNLVTPLGPVAQTESNAVIAPGAMGEFEILEGHVPYLSELHPGVLQIGEGSSKRVFAVSSGFLEVEPSGAVKVLVEKALPSGDVDSDSVSKEYAEIKSAIDSWDGDMDGAYQTLKDREAWCNAQSDALKR